MPKKKNSKKPLEPLEAVKRLLILQLLISGAKSEDIAKLLNIDSSVIRHMISMKKIKKIQKEIQHEKTLKKGNPSVSR